MELTIDMSDRLAAEQYTNMYVSVTDPNANIVDAVTFRSSISDNMRVQFEAPASGIHNIEIRFDYFGSFD